MDDSRNDQPETELTNDPDGESHRKLDPRTGQQKAYVVLSQEERDKGYTEPYRDRYIHETCGATTRMAHAIAATYARQPEFYSGTFCCHCHAHFPVGADGEFIWEGTHQKVGTRQEAGPEKP